MKLIANEGWNGVTDAVDLKIKPKVCRMCGHKYIPTGGNQKYCQECRKKMTKKPPVSKLKKDTEAVFGPGSYKGDADPEEHHPAAAKETPPAEPEQKEDPKAAPEEPAADQAEGKESSVIDIELKINGRQLARMMIDKETVVGIVRVVDVIRALKGAIKSQ